MAKLLLVEDDKNLREIYGTRLAAEGYTIVAAGDGEEALALAIKERPDLIVSDVMMPKISGFDMLDILRSTTETRDVKVIMMTALSSEDQRQRGEQLGADRYLVKSQVGIEDVVRTVHEVLGDGSVESSTPAPTSVPATPPLVSAPVESVPAAEPFVPPAATVPTIPVPPQNNTADALPPMAQPTPFSAAPAAPTTPPAPAAPSTVSNLDTFAPQPVQLPQPTAPFSTPRPRGLGDRIIQPIERPDDGLDSVADRMQAELGTRAPGAPIAPAVPTPAPASAPTVPPTPKPVAPPQNTMPQMPPVPQPPQFTPVAPPSLPPIDLNFEETPRVESTGNPPSTPPPAAQ